MIKIYYPARITKTELRSVISNFRGTINGAMFRLGSNEYQPGMLMFLGFEGNRVGKDFIGRYVFRETLPRDLDEKDIEDFNELPGLEVLCRP